VNAKEGNEFGEYNQAQVFILTFIEYEKVSAQDN
jgi:hypothetical protein